MSRLSLHETDNAFRGYAGWPVSPSGRAKPKLSVARSYYQANIMPRRDALSKKKLEQGEDPEGSEPYPLRVTDSALSGFGQGVAIYFITLKALVFVMFFLGLFQIHAILYFQGPLYSDSYAGEDALGKRVPLLLRGSAICTLQNKVCLDERCEDKGIVNHCKIGEIQANLDVYMTGVLLLVVLSLSWWTQRKANALDESVQTAQDCKNMISIACCFSSCSPTSLWHMLCVDSIMVDDPSPSALDPDRWQQFFSEYGHVTFVAVAIDNGRLLKALSKRRY